MSDDTHEYYLSASSYEEFQRQDVFSTLEEFVAAMPPATRSIHLIPTEMVDVTGLDKESLVVVVAFNEADMFGPLSNIHTNPTREDPSTDDESMYRVDDANDLLKQGQAVRDEIHREYRPQLNYPTGDREPWENHHHPGDADEYKRNHLNRDYANSSTMPEFMVLIPYEVLVAKTQKVALTWADITAGLNTAVRKRGDKCHVSLKRADPKNNRWTFTVSDPHGSGKRHTVQLKAIPRNASTTKLEKVDLKIGCSCEFWKWQGPDHHAAQNNYLDKKPRSDGSAPTVRDPQGKNRVCKHVYAASKFFMNYRLQNKTSGSLPPGWGSMNGVASRAEGEKAVAEGEAALRTASVKNAKTSLTIRRVADNLNKHT
jgi:hypothetical protein